MTLICSQKQLGQNHTVPYQNRWGHWVWTVEGGEMPKSWPGEKPPSKDVVPVLIGPDWYWGEK